MMPLSFLIWLILTDFTNLFSQMKQKHEKLQSCFHKNVSDNRKYFMEIYFSPRLKYFSFEEIQVT